VTHFTSKQNHNILLSFVSRFKTYTYNFNNLHMKLLLRLHISIYYVCYITLYC